MNRKQGASGRPASSEEVAFWSQTATSLNTLSDIYQKSTSQDTIGRVNRLISTWPSDDIVPAEGFDSVKSTHKKLSTALEEIQNTSKEEIKAIEAAMEQLDILMALRKAPETLPQDKRNKRPRAASPSSTPAPVAQQSGPSSRGVSITLPARASPMPPFNKEPKARREALAKQLPLKEGRKVAFHAPPNKNTGEPQEDQWILAVVVKSINADKNRYTVRDPEPQENGEPGEEYNTTLRSMIPLPDPQAPPGSATSLAAYREFPVGATVMALYPDTSVFYRAEVVASPQDFRSSGKNGYSPTYKVKFEDDDNQEHNIAAQWVVECPGHK